MEKFCNCETIGAVARDGKSTCMQCGGMDAYKKSELRISDCGCRFKNNESSAVLLCEKCSELPCHGGQLTKEPKQ